MNPSSLMKPTHEFFSWNLARKIKHDPLLKIDTEKDHNQIRERLILSFALKSLKLVILITNLSYFIGHFWYIYCEIGSSIDLEVNARHHENPAAYNTEHFLKFFNLDHTSPKTNLQVSIILMYYAFTSMSTVGFGDYHPRSDYERVFCALILLFGVTMFSYIMGTFSQILSTI